VSLSDGGAPRSAAKDDPVEEEAIARGGREGDFFWIVIFCVERFQEDVERRGWSDTMSAMVRTMTSAWSRLRVNIDGTAPSVAYTW
jgi:hypothetical protein